MTKRKRRRCRRDDRRREGEDEPAKKPKPACADICDDALLSIFSRLTTRDAARCAALSKHHRRLLGGVDFWLLHRRLSPPLPCPSIACMLTVSASGYMFFDFHLAGLVAGGRPGGEDNGVRYSLVDRVHLNHRYVGTCNGLILLAPGRFNGGESMVLFNPAIAGSEEAVPLELPLLPESGRYRVSGFGYGYGTSRRAHKVLVTREERDYPDKSTSRRAVYRAKELLVYTLGGSTDPNRRLRSVLSELDAEISGGPVYLDGKIYLLADHSRVLAFDVDDKSVATIDLPGEHVPGKRWHARSELMEVSGRLCVATGAVKLSLWLLAPDGQWVRLCELDDRCGGGSTTRLAGAWDCGGVVLVYFIRRPSEPAYLRMYDTRDGERLPGLTIPRVVAKPGVPGSVLCWGYRPTLVSPGSIVGAPPRQRGGVLAAPLNPLLERDVDAGRERTLEAVCLVNLLRYIMTRLPDHAGDVIKEIRKLLPFSLR